MSVIVFTCEKCHATDSVVTGCRRAFSSHGGKMLSKCDVCGKCKVVAPCYNYRRLTKKPSQTEISPEVYYT